MNNAFSLTVATKVSIVLLFIISALAVQPAFADDKSTSAKMQHSQSKASDHKRNHKGTDNDKRKRYKKAEKSNKKEKKIEITLTVPPAITREATAPLSPVSIGVATAADDDGKPVPFSNDAPDLFPVGVTVVTWTAWEEARDDGIVRKEHIVTATQTVTITDTTPPIVTPPANITMEATGPTTAVVLGTATATDIVDGTLTATPDNTGPFTVGVHTITWSATDHAGNTGTATQTVTITNTTPPVITPPANITMEATGPTTAVVLGTATATDLVDGTLTATPDNTGPFAVGVHTITWSATDQAGNTGTATQTVTITDTVAPVITPPVDMTVEATGALSFILDLGIATVTDLVDTGLIATNDAPAAFPLGTTVVTWSAVDNAGNMGIAIQNITVQDTTAPVLTAPADIYAEATGALSVVNIGMATATDLFAVTITNDAPASFSLGVTTVTWTATDANGNSTSATQTVVISDTTPPTITAPDITMEATGLTTAVPQNVSATDIVDGSVTATADITGPFTVGVYTITWSAADAAGNTSTAMQTVTITDTAAPTVTPPANITMEATAVLTPVTLGAATASDLVDVILVVAPDTTGPFGVGVHTVTWSVTDAAGNTGTATQTVTITDTTPPVITAPPAVTAQSLDSNPVTVAIGSATATDIFPVTVTNDAPAMFPVGVTTVTWTATDAGGNSAIAAQTVTVVFIDSDGDGVGDNVDAFPNDPAASVDSDGDGYPDAWNPGKSAADSTSVPPLTLDAFPNDAYRSAVLPSVRITSPATLTTTAASPVLVTGITDTYTATVTLNGAQVAVDASGAFQGNVNLFEGGNTIVARVVTADGRESTDSISLYLDLVAPYMTITYPAEGAVVYSPTIAVGGLVNDIVRGTVSATQANVTANGIQGTVNNRSYVVDNVPLTPGLNTITVNGSDQVGNVGTTSVTVTYKPVSGAMIEPVSGQGQSASILSALAQPLSVRLLDNYSQPVAGKNVVFRVIQGDGKLGSFLTAYDSTALIATTDANGVASTGFKLGSRAGNGNHRVRATAVGFDGEVLFSASATPNPGDKISVNSGNNQRGAAGMALGLPFVAVVTDEGGNVVEGAQVEFKVEAGGGHFIDGSSSYITTTDSDGRASVAYVLGFEPGFDNHKVSAKVIGKPFFAAFTASALTPGDPGNTSISGVVLDNQDTPIEGVTMRVAGMQRTAVTDVYGQFTITQVPVGPVHLVAEGATAVTPGEWPTLSQNIITVAGANNPLAAPIYMVKLDTAHAQWVGDKDVSYTLPQIPGFQLDVKAGSVTFPDGSKTGQISVTAVNASKVPMAPPNGMQPQFIVTIQPVGAVFDPPAPLTLPNVDGHAPGAEVEMYSFDHDLEEFVAIGLGTVSTDGSVIKSNPGVGVVKAGWHCGSQPTGSGTGFNCAECEKCDGKQCVPGPDGPKGECQACQGGSVVNLDGPKGECKECQGGTLQNKAKGSETASKTECKQCDGNGGIENAPQGSVTTSKTECKQCDGNGGLENAPDGPKGECQECQGGSVVNLDGPKGECQECQAGALINSPFGQTTTTECQVCDGNGGTTDAPDGDACTAGGGAGQCCSGTCASGKVTAVDITTTPAAQNGNVTVAPNSTVAFTATATLEGDCAETYEWDFGDGATGIGAVASHIYTTVGAYTATVTVTCTANACSDPVSNTVSVNVGGELRILNAGTPMQDNEKALIDTTPTMPAITAEVTFGGSASPLTGTVDWSLALNYAAAGPTLTKSTSLPSDQSWDITAAIGAIRGGDLTVTASMNGDSLTKSIQIRGTNPSKSNDVPSALGTTTLQKIACQESSQLQFNPDLPYLSSDGKLGSGIMQVTPASIAEMWNWKTNVTSGKSIFGNKLKSAQAFPGRIQKSQSLKDMLVAYNNYHSVNTPGFTPITTMTIPAFTAEQERLDGIRGYNGWSGTTRFPLVGFELHEYEPRIEVLNGITLTVLTINNEIIWDRVPWTRRTVGDPNYVNNVEGKLVPCP